MTQEDYKLWTGEDASTYTTEQWKRIVANASTRLASFLCLETLPTNDQGQIEDDLQELLANFIAAVLEHQGTTGAVASKHVRNFTISFSKTTAANAFAQIAAQYGDLIEKYSQCDLGIDVEKTSRYFCGNYWGGCGC